VVVALVVEVDVVADPTAAVDARTPADGRRLAESERAAPPPFHRTARRERKAS